MFRSITLLFGVLLIVIVSWLTSGCAQIGSPTGGPRDSLAPVLIKVEPAPNTTNFRGNRVVFNFDEFIEIQDLQNNLIISPLQKNSPTVSYNSRTVTVRFRDTLLPNTTYNINFGNAVRDINEGNVYPELNYTFSTGDIIDSLSFGGKVVLAETGTIDTTLVALLYRNAHDTTVLSARPQYLAKLRGDGNFVFNNLPAGNYKVYALKDGDGGKTYNSKKEIFAFHDSDIVVSEETGPVTLYAYQEEKVVETRPVTGTRQSRNITYTTSFAEQAQDVLLPLELVFNKAISDFNESGIRLVDSAFVPVNGVIYQLDSSRTKLRLSVPWKRETSYKLLIEQNAVEDTAGNMLPRGDTLTFLTRKTEDYGTLLLRFQGLELDRNPVLQFINGGIVRYAYPLTSMEWSSQLFPPGEYELRILFDSNGNGIWDPGNYELKRQPERAITLPQKLSIRANWDNERDIRL